MVDPEFATDKLYGKLEQTRDFSNGGESEFARVMQCFLAGCIPEEEIERSGCNVQELMVGQLTLTFYISPRPFPYSKHTFGIALVFWD
jgi:hypothetical protein